MLLRTQLYFYGVVGVMTHRGTTKGEYPDQSSAAEDETAFARSLDNGGYVKRCSSRCFAGSLRYIDADGNSSPPGCPRYCCESAWLLFYSVQKAMLTSHAHLARILRWAYVCVTCRLSAPHEASKHALVERYH
jgi:hypothetical protein